MTSLEHDDSKVGFDAHSVPASPEMKSIPFLFSGGAWCGIRVEESCDTIIVGR
jgi:imidazole glycerol phosphate synthase subunit HisF